MLCTPPMLSSPHALLVSAAKSLLPLLKAKTSRDRAHHANRAAEVTIAVQGGERHTQVLAGGVR